MYLVFVFSASSDASRIGLNECGAKSIRKRVTEPDKERLKNPNDRDSKECVVKKEEKRER